MSDNSRDTGISGYGFGPTLALATLNTLETSMESTFLTNMLGRISVVAGYLSIISWLFAQLPQVIKIYNTKSLEGVSLAFLLVWFVGDFLNFTSCLLNDAMAFQILLSGYYCMIDLILAGQFYYYTHMYRLHHHHHHNQHHQHPLKKTNRLTTIKSTPDELAATTSIQLPPEHISIPVTKPGSSSLSIKNSWSSFFTASFVTSFNKVQAMPIPDELMFTASSSLNWGPILAWACTSCYLSSRIPQLITNYKLKTTSGISIKLFISALLGNLFYSISLLANFYQLKLLVKENSPDSIPSNILDIYSEFWERELSYFLGAIGTVSFDILVLFQFFKWDRGHSTHLNKKKSFKVIKVPKSFEAHPNSPPLDNTAVPTGSTSLIHNDYDMNVHLEEDSSPKYGSF
ncbi:Putative vacuolar membrane transporter for cationic amino acids [Komagataella phaffii CBS 7435]|uniref:Uncharacterized protein n=2 Tax=Komagataella phaffii TaxID=460519 RepID=C4R6U4_KOMPG|nr:uncharacterized protein PAS_chr4_0092 [Komagataella phaffii GS115]AOA65340.1 GQ67_04401T0 [Komagataella phaffii]CAH2451337.1 Putative vacuolar membrane transporter for cationic amino acids [Komagataella phaffii CBS 7435]AOA70220.1 GQ68_04373T0 [Komagataella phaffii GS115]CAY71319.1 Putative protein of unknown function [Komagataella phaffii GS115]CCA41075.1 Putative vacuolar membrane transporter for cationic amino acids [Komagataella phaffii CBS 7435]